MPTGMTLTEKYVVRRRLQRLGHRAEADENGGLTRERLGYLLGIADEYQAGTAGVRGNPAMLGTRVQIAVQVREYVRMSRLDRLSGNHRQLLLPESRCISATLSLILRPHGWPVL
jgi:hypothetical protein